MNAAEQLALAAGLFLVGKVIFEEWQLAQRYGVPMFSEASLFVRREGLVVTDQQGAPLPYGELSLDQMPAIPL